MSYPDSPLNIFVAHPYIIGHLDIIWDDARYLPNNINKIIVGYNVYRSYDTPHGTYTKLNTTPVGTLFYRDSHQIATVIDETPIICTTGDHPTGAFAILTQNRPIVKDLNTTIYKNTYNTLSLIANRPQDIKLTINGTTFIPDKIDGWWGKIWFYSRSYWDTTLNRMVDFIIPPDADIKVSYKYTKNTVVTKLNQRLYYKVTTVDSLGNETPLENVTPASFMEEDRLDYMWKEALRRSSWILDQSGERVKVFLRKYVGEVCHHYNASVYNQSRNDCKICYGTNIVGGYEGPYDILIAPQDMQRNVQHTDLGLHLNAKWSSWTLNTPVLSQRDFFVKTNGERYGIGMVQQPSVRGTPLLQSFEVSYLDESSIYYLVPLTGSQNVPATLQADANINEPKDTMPAGQQRKGRTKKFGIIET